MDVQQRAPNAAPICVDRAAVAPLGDVGDRQQRRRVDAVDH